MTTTNDLAEQSPLGKSSAYRTDYAPELLFPIPRQGKRDELELRGTLPFFGLDINPWRSNFSTGTMPGNLRNARQ